MLRLQITEKYLANQLTSGSQDSLHRVPSDVCASVKDISVDERHASPATHGTSLFSLLYPEDDKSVVAACPSWSQ